jgi:hypothetical protein
VFKYGPLPRASPREKTQAVIPELTISKTNGLVVMLGSGWMPSLLAPLLAQIANGYRLQNDHTQDIFERLRHPSDKRCPGADIFTYNNMLMYVSLGKARDLLGPHPSCNIPATESVIGPDQLSTWCRCFPRRLAAGVKRWDVSAQIVQEMVARGIKIQVRTYTILMDGTVHADWPARGHYWPGLSPYLFDGQRSCVGVLIGHCT